MARLRTNKKALSILTQNLNFVETPSNWKNCWKNYFQNNNKIEIEIGCGKGNFIINHALNNFNKNFIGIDLSSTILLKINYQIENMNLNNFSFFNTNAINLLNIFSKNEIDKIYLNFPDPWPKKKHEKRRLTTLFFLKIYKDILSPKGLINFKTDNDNLYKFTLENLKKINAAIIFNTTDLHSEKVNLNGIMSEYERKFFMQGKAIKQVCFNFKKDFYE